MGAGDRRQGLNGLRAGGGDATTRTGVLLFSRMTETCSLVKTQLGAFAVFINARYCNHREKVNVGESYF